MNINNEKMSKSLGNFFTIRDVLKKVHPESLRLFVLSKHYGVPWTSRTKRSRKPNGASKGSTGHSKRCRNVFPTCPTPPLRTRPFGAQDAELFDEIAALPASFIEAMDNDFNTAQALGYLFGLQRHLQRFMDRFGQKKLKGPAAVLAWKGATTLREHSGILGLTGGDAGRFFEEQKKLKLSSTGLTEEEVERAIESRHLARQEKNFAEADAIRLRLEEKHIVLEDSPKGTRWRIVV